jgi:hypothetical protein
VLPASYDITLDVQMVEPFRVGRAARCAARRWHVLRAGTCWGLLRR